MEVPMLVTAREGMEGNAIQAFRLGARDYLVKPLREAEVLAAAERALNEVRLRHERQQLAEQLAESNRQLERRVRELTTIYGIGKAVTSTTNQSQLFTKLMEGSLYVCEADLGWVLLVDETTEKLVLRAQSHLPPAIAGKLHQPWDDGVSSLVMLSGESLSIHGEGLSKFKLNRLAKAALLAPIKVRDKPIGIICVAHQDARPFTEREQRMLEAVADYASISLVNARLFQALEARASRLQKMVERGAQAEPTDEDELRQSAAALRSGLERLAESTVEPGLQAQIEALRSVAESLGRPGPAPQAKPAPPAA
jgi:two-component system NtrC family sensor kinase